MYKICKKIKIYDKTSRVHCREKLNSDLDSTTSILGLYQKSDLRMKDIKKSPKFTVRGLYRADVTSDVFSRTHFRFCCTSELHPFSMTKYDSRLL